MSNWYSTDVSYCSLVWHTSILVRWLIFQRIFIWIHFVKVVYLLKNPDLFPLDAHAHLHRFKNYVRVRRQVSCSSREYAFQFALCWYRRFPTSEKDKRGRRGRVESGREIFASLVAGVQSLPSRMRWNRDGGRVARDFSSEDQ